MGKKFLLAAAALSAILHVASAADCDTSQQRQNGDPTGDQIATALAKSNIQKTACSGQFPPGNNNIATFNWWGMVYNVTRTDATAPLQNCDAGFANIVEQCIKGGNYWGGVWSLNGFTYTIRNTEFPANGLAPTDDGGPKGNSGNAVSTVVTETIDGKTLTGTVRFCFGLAASGIFS